MSDSDLDAELDAFLADTALPVAAGSIKKTPAATVAPEPSVSDTEQTKTTEKIQAEEEAKKRPEEIKAEERRSAEQRLRRRNLSVSSSP